MEPQHKKTSELDPADKLCGDAILHVVHDGANVRTTLKEALWVTARPFLWVIAASAGLWGVLIGAAVWVIDHTPAN